jgi:hypothetical protein
MAPSLELGTAGRHRYGIVLAVAVSMVVSLFVVVATSRTGDRTARESMSIALVLVTVGVGLAVLLGWIPKWIASALAGLLVLVTLYQLVRGVARLLREKGVTVQAVAGALAVYLLLGIAFSLAISVAAKFGHGTYFAQGTDGTESQHVYFSFTTLTTTGYGDLSPAARGGRALAVLEMLIGQIYLVTLIAGLVSLWRPGRWARRNEES